VSTGKTVTARPFVITVEFELENDVFPEFLRQVTENAATSVRLEAHCLRFDVLTPSAAGAIDRVLLYEIYTDRAAFDVHLESEHFKIFDETTRTMVRKKTVVQYEIAQHAKMDARI
jgi:autoinducer 2-degrading protein